jgi:hypothetical protein
MLIQENSSGIYRLRLFVNGIDKDRLLPKFKTFVHASDYDQPKNSDPQSTDFGFLSSSQTSTTNVFSNSITSNGFLVSNSFGVNQPIKNPSFVDSLIKKLKSKFQFKQVAPKEPLPTYTAQQVFNSIKKSLIDLEVYDAKLKTIEEMIKRASAAGQTALKEKYIHNKNVATYEARLASSPTKKYIDEKDLVTFVKESEKGLRLDYVKNFTREIPEDIIKKKIDQDALMVFDNYVILHFDPDAKSFKLTQKEEAELEAKRKDPILFGVIEGSTKLYYVGDWIDELCNLTFDQLVDHFKETKIETELK